MPSVADETDMISSVASSPLGATKNLNKLYGTNTSVRQSEKSSCTNVSTLMAKLDRQNTLYEKSTRKQIATLGAQMKHLKAQLRSDLQSPQELGKADLSDNKATLQALVNNLT